MDLTSLSVPTQWKLEDGLELVRALQPLTRKYGYHLALGGGVLNKGYSDKDLDLYFLPMGGYKMRANPEGLVDWLTSMWGSGDPIGHGEYPEELPYIQRLTFAYGRQRIDVFVLGGVDEKNMKDFADEDESEAAEDTESAERPYDLFFRGGHRAGRAQFAEQAAEPVRGVPGQILSYDPESFRVGNAIREGAISYVQSNAAARSGSDWFIVGASNSAPDWIRSTYEETNTLAAPAVGGINISADNEGPEGTDR